MKRLCTVVSSPQGTCSAKIVEAIAFGAGQYEMVLVYDCQGVDLKNLIMSMKKLLLINSKNASPESCHAVGTK